MSALIKFDNVTIFQDERPVIGNLSLEIKAREFVYLLGKTGSGKSSFLKSLYGDVPVTVGSGSVCGYSLRDLRPGQIPYLRRKLGIVFQDFQLMNDRSVYENLRFVM